VAATTSGKEPYVSLGEAHVGTLSRLSFPAVMKKTSSFARLDKRRFTAAGVPPPEGLTCLRSLLGGEVEVARFPSSDAARSFRSPAIHPCHPPHTPSTQIAVRNRVGRPVAVDVRSAPRAEESENCETSTEDRRAEKMKALHIGGRWESVPAPHRPPVFRSTYLARLLLEIVQSNSRAAIIAPRAMQWEAFFHRLFPSRSDRRIWRLRSVQFWESIRVGCENGCTRNSA
jgi:hypothetical protein